MSAFESIVAEKIGEEYEVLFDWTPEVINTLKLGRVSLLFTNTITTTYFCRIIIAYKRIRLHSFIHHRSI